MLFFRIRHEWTWWWLASCSYSLSARCQLIWHHDSVLWRFFMVEIRQKSLNIIWRREYCLWITLSVSYAIIITMRSHLSFFIRVKSWKKIKKNWKFHCFLYTIHFLNLLSLTFLSFFSFLSKIYYFYYWKLISWTFSWYLLYYLLKLLRNQDQFHFLRNI